MQTHFTGMPHIPFIHMTKTTTINSVYNRNKYVNKPNVFVTSTPKLSRIEVNCIPNLYEKEVIIA